MVRTVSLTFPLIVTALIGVCLGGTSRAQAQGFPDPIKNPRATAPARKGADVFPPPGRNGYGKRPPNPFRVTVSAFSPDSRTISRGLGTLLNVDVEYDAYTSRLLGGPTLIGFFADFAGGNRYRRRDSAEYDASVLGLGFIARRIFTESLDKSHFYIGAGAGYYATRLEIDPLGPRSFSKSGSGLGYRLQGGYQFSRNFYAQLDILSLESLRTRNADGRLLNINPSGARFGVGYQF